MISKKVILTIARKYKEKYMYNNFIYNALVELEEEIESTEEE